MTEKKTKCNNIVSLGNNAFDPYEILLTEYLQLILLTESLNNIVSLGNNAFDP